MNSTKGNEVPYDTVKLQKKISDKSENISRLIPASEVLKDMRTSLRDYFDEFLLFSLYNYIITITTIIYINNKNIF